MNCPKCRETEWSYIGDGPYALVCKCGVCGNTWDSGPKAEAKLGRPLELDLLTQARRQLNDLSSSIGRCRGTRAMSMLHHAFIERLLLRVRLHLERCESHYVDPQFLPPPESDPDLAEPLAWRFTSSAPTQMPVWAHHAMTSSTTVGSDASKSFCHIRTADGREVKCEVGDWIIRDKNGGIHVLTERA